MCKNLGVTPEYVLHNMTYQNVMLFSHATPTYESKKEDKKGNKNGTQWEWDDSLDANNPDNFNDEPTGKVTTIH